MPRPASPHTGEEGHRGPRAPLPPLELAAAAGARAAHCHRADDSATPATAVLAQAGRGRGRRAWATSGTCMVSFSGLVSSVALTVRSIHDGWGAPSERRRRDSRAGPRQSYASRDFERKQRKGVREKTEEGVRDGGKNRDRHVDPYVKLTVEDWSN